MSPRARPAHSCALPMDGCVCVAGFELVWAFMQFNSVRALSNSHDVASFLLPATCGGGGGAAGDWGPEPDGLDQAATALAVYSDIDVLMACR